MAGGSEKWRLERQFSVDNLTVIELNVTPAAFKSKPEALTALPHLFYYFFLSCFLPLIWKCLLGCDRDTQLQQALANFHYSHCTTLADLDDMCLIQYSSGCKRS